MPESKRPLKVFLCHAMRALLVVEYRVELVEA